jgi:hypothetical protein
MKKHGKERNSYLMIENDAYNCSANNNSIKVEKFNLFSPPSHRHTITANFQEDVNQIHQIGDTSSQNSSMRLLGNYIFIIQIY